MKTLLNVAMRSFETHKWIGMMKTSYKNSWSLLCDLMTSIGVDGVDEDFPWNFSCSLQSGLIILIGVGGMMKTFKKNFSCNILWGLETHGSWYEQWRYIRLTFLRANCEVSTLYSQGWWKIWRFLFKSIMRSNVWHS